MAHFSKFRIIVSNFQLITRAIRRPISISSPPPPPPPLLTFERKVFEDNNIDFLLATAKFSVDPAECLDLVRYEVPEPQVLWANDDRRSITTNVLSSLAGLTTSVLSLLLQLLIVGMYLAKGSRFFLTTLVSGGTTWGKTMSTSKRDEEIINGSVTTPEDTFNQSISGKVQTLRIGAFYDTFVS
ncbi:hypothetical protein LguiB_012094 [Lonicera macranthoides]